MIEEDELIRIWQSSSNQDRIKFEKSKLILEMKSSLDRFHKSVRYRDLHELIGALIMIPVFAYYIYIIPFLLTQVASFLIIVLLIFVNIKLKKLKKHKPNTLSDSYIDYLYQCQNYLRLQKKMRDTAPYWYILPLSVCIILFILGVSLGRNMNLDQLIYPLSIIIGCIVFVYLYNAWIIKKQYLPRLKKLEELIKTMEA